MHCIVHPDRPAVAYCTRCARTCCKGCVTEGPHGPFCTKCAPRHLAATAGSAAEVATRLRRTRQAAWIVACIAALPTLGAMLSAPLWHPDDGPATAALRLALPVAALVWYAVWSMTITAAVWKMTGRGPGGNLVILATPKAWAELAVAYQFAAMLVGMLGYGLYARAVLRRIERDYTAMAQDAAHRLSRIQHDHTARIWSTQV